MSEFTPAPTAERRGIQPPVLIALGVVVVIGLIALFVTFAGGDDDDEDGDRVETAAGAGEVFLEPTDGSGTDPFSESVAAPTPSTTQPLGTPVALGETGVTAPALGTSTTSGAVSSYTGGTPGLYGGTRDQRACDPQKMVSFLAANPDKAQAWADAQGIPVGEVTAYIEALTPVLLRGDTRVTNHGFRNGVATARQSVLQAGTAVLVDKYGEPQARCACLCTRSAHSRAPLTPKFERLGKRHNGVSVGETPIGTSTVRVLCVDGDRRIGYSPGLLHPSLCGLGQRGTLDGRRHLVQTRKQRFVRRCSLSTYIPARHQCQQNSNSQPGR